MAQLHTESSGPFFAQLGIGSTGTIFAQLHSGALGAKIAQPHTGSSGSIFARAALQRRGELVSRSSIEHTIQGQPNSPGQAVRGIKSPYTKTPWHSGQGEKKKRVGAAVY
jgi:hypothetical protein